MDVGKRSKGLGSDRSSYSSQHSKQHQHQHVDVSYSWHSESHRVKRRARYPCSGLHFRKGTLSLRNLLFYCQWWASLLFVLETVPQGYSEQKHTWKMTQVKSSQGLAFLTYFAKCVGMDETLWKIGPIVWMTKTEFTNFLKTALSSQSRWRTPSSMPVTQSKNWWLCQASPCCLVSSSQLTTEFVSCGCCNKLT